MLWILLACSPLSSPSRQAPTGDGGAVDDGGSLDGGGSDGGSQDGGAVQDGGGAGDAGTSDGGVGDGGAVAAQELRGLWLTRFEWPSLATDAESMDALMADIAAAGFNAVFFQVRGNHDAYYPSSLEPWASGLTGTLGQDPGWDPLAAAVAGAHAHGMQLHAYINVAPFWRGTEDPASVGVTHPYTDHPDWLVADSSGTPMALNSSYVYASPGVPSMRAWTAAVAEDIALRYDVDGIHLDYIRYPGSGYSHDATSESRYAIDTDASGLWAGLSWGDWQREMVKDIVRQVRDAVDVPVTAAVWGIHTDEWGWGSVSEGDGDYYQDSRAFLSEGLTDANLPMAYWEVADTEGDRLDFRTLARDHVAHAAGRHVYMGIGIYDIGYEESVRCIEAAREEGAQGVVLFSWSSTSAHAAELAAGPFAEPAVVPDMPWR